MRAERSRCVEKRISALVKRPIVERTMKTRRKTKQSAKQSETLPQKAHISSAMSDCWCGSSAELSSISKRYEDASCATNGSPREKKRHKIRPTAARIIHVCATHSFPLCLWSTIVFCCCATF